VTIAAGKWFLIILTASGGDAIPQKSLGACRQHMKQERVSRTREVFCMTEGRDARVFQRDGKEIAEIR
jgi:hypothetical protein